MKPPRVSSVLLLLVAAAVGWGVAGWEDRRNPAPESEGAPPRRTERDRAKVSLRPERDAGVEARLEAIRAASTPEERMSLAIALARELTPAQLQTWFEGNWFQTDNDLAATAFYRVARARWAEEDPESLVRYDVSHGTDKASDSARAWARKDPAAAFAFLREPRASGGSFSYGLLRGLAEVDPETALEAVAWMARQDPASAYGNANSGVHGVFDELAESAPDRLRQALDELPREFRDRARQSLAGATLRADFGQGLDELAELPKGREIFCNLLSADESIRKRFLENLGSLPEGWLNEMATDSWRLPLHTKEDWLGIDYESFGVKPEVAGKLRLQIVQRMGWQDPEAMIAGFAKYDWSDDERTTLIATAGHVLKSRDDVEALLARIPNAEDAEAVRQRIEAERHAETSESATLEASPADWLRDLTESETSRYRHGGAPPGSDTRSGRDALVQALRGFDPETRTEVSQRLISGSMGGFDSAPELLAVAVDQLLREPRGEADDARQLARAASETAANWAERDPMAASAWVNSLPASEERTWAAKNVAARWSEYEPDPASAWVRGLPAEERAAVEAHLQAESR